MSNNVNPKPKHHINSATALVTITKVVKPLRLRIYYVIRKLLIGFILASIVNFGFSYFFHTPKVFSLSKQNNELLIKYKLLANKIEKSSEKLGEIKSRDNGIYKTMFGLDTISYKMSDEYIFDDYYSDYSNNRYAEVVRDMWSDVNNLKSNLYVQSISLDTIQYLAKDKEKMSEALPTIWPLDRTRMKGRIGAFGFRFHPILRVRAGHDGIDIPGPVGLPIYSTADGVVEHSGRESEYGISVVINHGYGYKTRYAHLSKAIATVGQRVKRGEKIGLLGNTGRSTGPHLHYEVRYRGRPVNPLNYFSRDMSPEDFNKIIESAVATTYEQ